MTSRRSRVLLILPLVGCVWLAGCVKQVRSSVPAFAQAAELTSTNVQAAFQTVNDTYTQAETIHFVVTYDGTVDPGKIPTGWLPQDSVDVRMQILQGLKQYASELSSLTGSNDIDSLNKASTAMGMSLKDLAKTPQFSALAKKVPSNISDQAATAVDTLGNWLIELKLKKELPALIEKMDPNIQTLCALLSEDIGSLDPNSLEGSGLRQVLWIQYNRIILAQNQWILHNTCGAKDAPANCFSPEVRLAEIQKLPTLVRQRNTSDQTLQQVKVTLKQLAQANTELVKAAQTNQDMNADIGDLLAESQRLYTYYNSLSSGK